MSARITWMMAAMLLIAMACQSPDKNRNSSQPQAERRVPEPNGDFFQKISPDLGIDFKHSIGDQHLDNLVESVGGGAVFLDYDQDGFIDLYVSNGAYVENLSDGERPEGQPINRLYRNRQDGTFEDVTKKAGVGDDGYGMGMTVGDLNNDGYPDIYVTNYGPNVLYLNNGDGTFTNIAQKAGVAENACSVGAVWLDYDNDGWLDLYVGNYIDYDPDYGYFYAPDGFPGPMAYDGQLDRLYHNKGNETFEDVTEKMGIDNPDGRAMGVGAADFNGDGYTDIFVANDHMVNNIYENEEGKKFVDQGTRTGMAFNQSGEATISMSVDFADYNGDGLIDVFMSDDTYCSLYQNQGNGVFVDMAYPSGISMAAAQHVGWSSSFFDFDNDGDVDIFKANGELKHLYGQEDQIFENLDGSSFRDASTELGAYFQEENVGRGACIGDYDNDGDLDIYIVNLDDEGVFLRNNRGNENNWITFHLVGTSSNRDALGALVTIEAAGKKQVAVRRSTTGYLSQNDHRLHFGLGDATLVNRVQIKWPSGHIQELEGLEANQIVTVTEE
ncbi:MAG: CRTAC1 family protein [Bacteroidales bacterium]